MVGTALNSQSHEFYLNVILHGSKCRDCSLFVFKCLNVYVKSTLFVHYISNVRSSSPVKYYITDQNLC